MAAERQSWYYDREQSLIKHIILRAYLERFAIIVGSRWGGILYVDGFCGPWNAQSENLDDTSFAIALAELRRARGAVKERFRKDLQIQCVFLEKNRASFERLREYAAAQRDVSITALNMDFEEAVPVIERHARTSAPTFFPFIFIDPTGWTGFAMRTIRPLLKLEPCEVLINFMTSFVLRFAEDSRHGIEASINELFGTDRFRSILENVVGQQREDALVFEYAAQLKAAGNFLAANVAVVPNPTKDRSHFHLVYGTRNLKGVEVFKEAERTAMEVSAEIRAEAKRRDREEKTGQSELLSGRELPDEKYLQDLATHYEQVAFAQIKQLLETRRTVAFDDIYVSAMKYPLVQLPRLREWCNEIGVPVFHDNSRVLKPGCDHAVAFRDGIGETGELPL